MSDLLTPAPEQQDDTTDKIDLRDARLKALEDKDAADDQELPEVDAESQVTIESEEPTTVELQEQFDQPAVQPVERNAGPEATSGSVTDRNVLDLREKNRADAEAAAQQRIAGLQEMADAGEHTVTPEALDRQAERAETPPTPPQAEQVETKQKGLVERGVDFLLRRK